jgi:hypothetical protein
VLWQPAQKADERRQTIDVENVIRWRLQYSGPGESTDAKTGRKNLGKRRICCPIPPEVHLLMFDWKERGGPVQLRSITPGAIRTTPQRPWEPASAPTAECIQKSVCWIFRRIAGRSTLRAIMRNLAAALIWASVLTFVMATILVIVSAESLARIGIRTGPEGLSRASSNLALIAIALGVWFRSDSDDSGGDV